MDCSILKWLLEAFVNYYPFFIVHDWKNQKGNFSLCYIWEVHVVLQVKLVCSVGFRHGVKYPNHKTCSFTENSWLLQGQYLSGEIKDVSCQTVIPFQLPGSCLSAEAILAIIVCLYYCNKGSSTCMMKGISFNQPLQIASTNQGSLTQVELIHTFLSK